MNKWQKKYPPYEGPEPYLYFAFADRDSRKAWDIMKILLKRGCRVWYCAGPAGNSQELLRRQSRASGAELTLLYLTDGLEADKDSKSRIMVNQKNHKPILCLDTDGKNRYLAMDIHESTPGIPLYRLKKDAEVEDALIRADGFTQIVIGKPAKVKNNWLGKLTGIFFLLTLLLIGASFLYFQRGPVYDDSVSFSDPVIMEAARNAAGGGALSEESLTDIQVLRLTQLPESWDDLTMLPALEQIEIPQKAAIQAENLPVDSYRIVLYGGAA